MEKTIELIRSNDDAFWGQEGIVRGYEFPFICVEGLQEFIEIPDKAKHLWVTIVDRPAYNTLSVRLNSFEEISLIDYGDQRILIYWNALNWLCERSLYTSDDLVDGAYHLKFEWT